MHRPSKKKSLHDYDGVVQSALLALALGATAWLGAFQSIDGLFYDAVSRVALPVASRAPQKVILVEAPIEAFTMARADWQLAIDRMTTLGARQVAFSVLPTLERPVLQTLLRHPQAVVAAQLAPELQRSALPRLRLPAALGGVAIPAVVSIGDGALGVHRSAPYAVDTDAASLPSLEALVARRLRQDVPSSGTYLINFMQGSHRDFPRVSLQEVLDNHVLPEALRGRVALVGAVSTRFERTVATPITTASQQISELEYHGYALESLLSDRVVRSLSDLGQIGLLYLVWAGCVLLMQPLTFRRGFALASLAAAAFVAFSALLLPLATFYLPIVSTVLVIGTTTISVFQHKNRRLSHALSRLVNTTSVALANRWTARAPMDDKAFWNHLLGMIDQLLPLNRALLLVRLQGSTRMQEVCALRCSIDDISERRRDFMRTPYSTAIAREGAIEVPRYLKNAPVDEMQWLAPLRVDGEVLGFWAFGVPEHRVAEHATLHRAFEQVTLQLSELMAERRTLQRSVGFLERLSNRLSDERGKVVQRLSLHLRSVNRHFGFIEEIFEGLRSATVAYDPFGRTIAVNREMRALLTKVRIDPESASAPGLLEIFCAMTHDEARNVVCGVAFERNEFERTVYFDGTRYRVRCSALRAPAVAVEEQTPGLDSPLQGIVVEVFPLASTDVLDASGSDVWHAVQAAVTRVAARPENDGVECKADGLKDAPPVGLEADRLVDTLAAVLQLLTDDARRPGVIAIRVSELYGAVMIDIRNDGFGMPPDALRTVFDGAELPPNGPLRQIRALRDVAFATGGLTVESEVGHGYRVRIELPTVR